MTTIICTRDAMCADTKYTYGPDFTGIKIHRIGDSLIGCAGDAIMCDKFLNWKRGGEVPQFSDDAGISGLELTGDGRILLYANNANPVDVGGDHFGVGSGASYAIGALDAGATMRKAMSIAAKRDSNTGTEITILKRK